MKKLFSILILFVMLLTLSVPAFATDDNIISSNVVGVCENISLNEAMSDDGFSLQVNNSFNILPCANEQVYWKYWGEKGTEVLLGESQEYPIGYSQHMKGDIVLSTYHYTRTFVEVAGVKHGDSGRVWGTGQVRARGVHCPNAVWLTGVHKVYYGTTT